MFNYGDPKKVEIAFAQSYFAVQTQRAELIAERLELQERLKNRDRLRASEKQLSQNIYERGVDDKGLIEPMADNSTPEGRQKNRRVEMVFNSAQP